MTYNMLLVCMFLCVTCAHAQRSPYAGNRPIGYPELFERTTEALGNRFGVDGGTTERLPLEALGDRDLVNRLSKLPVDKQPFWYLNWKALEENRKNPQTFALKPNVFAGGAASSDGSVPVPVTNPESTPNAVVPNSAVTVSASGGDSQLGNRNGASNSDPTLDSKKEAPIASSVKKGEGKPEIKVDKTRATSNVKDNDNASFADNDSDEFVQKPELDTGKGRKSFFDYYW